MISPLAHLDATGRPCETHPAPSLDTLIPLAMVGSRAPGFHHDIASKLQGLMMALDEISEGVEGRAPELVRAAETAMGSLKELNTLLNTNRALTKTAPRMRVALRDLLSRACDRIYVKLEGAVPDAFVDVPAPSVTHALALVFDVAAGPGRGRTLRAEVSLADGHAIVNVAAAPMPPAASADSLGIATFVLARERGELRCADQGTRFVIRLPLAT